MSQRQQFSFVCRITLMTIGWSLACSGNAVWGQATRTWINTSSLNAYFDENNNWLSGSPPGAGDTALFNQDPGVPYDVWWDGFTPTVIPSIASAHVVAGDVGFLNLDANPQYALTLSGASGTGLLVSGSATSLIVEGLHLNSLANARIIGGAMLQVSGTHPAGSRLSVGQEFTIDGNFLATDAIVDSSATYIGDSLGSVGVATIANGSQWSSGQGVLAGFDGSGSLYIQSGASLTTGASLLGAGWNSGANGFIQVSDPGTQVTAAFTEVGSSGSGRLEVIQGSQLITSDIYLGVNVGSSGELLVSGNNSTLNGTGTIFVGFDGQANVEVNSGGTLATAAGVVGSGFNPGFVTVDGIGSQWNISGELFNNGGLVSVTGGGRISSGSTSLSGSTIWLDGPDSELDTGVLQIGDAGTSSLLVLNGSRLLSSQALLASNASAQIVGANSRWENSGDLAVGIQGNGILSIEIGGTVDTGSVSIGQLGGHGNVIVSGAGSQLNINESLAIGIPGGSGTLQIADGGTVSLANPGFDTFIGTTGNVELNGGRFEFRRMSLGSWSRVTGTGGTLSGDLVHDGHTHVSTLTTLSSSPFGLSEVRLENVGTLYGDGTLLVGLHNTSPGEVEVRSGERMRFAGQTNHNFGEINNFHGQIRFDGAMHNHGFIAGRGEFVANGGWQNHGVMAFSSGNADVLGDVELMSGSRIVTTGGATTTFFDDVVHNGTEIRTSANSHSVFLGSVTGGGNFTGSGTVYFEGDLRPGNSPALISFGGDLVLGSTSTLHIELGSLELDEYDQLQIAGDLSIDGHLMVSLLDGHSLGSNQQYLIANIGGSRTGFWNGLNEGSLVGSYGGTDLFITYSANKGSGIALFTAVPEPSSLLLLTACLAWATGTRRRRPVG